MNELNRKILDLLVDTGSVTASEIITEFGAKYPHKCIAALRKKGCPISDCKLWGNEKVYFLAFWHNITDEQLKKCNIFKYCNTTKN